MKKQESLKEDSESDEASQDRGSKDSEELIEKGLPNRLSVVIIDINKCEEEVMLLQLVSLRG